MLDAEARTLRFVADQQAAENAEIRGMLDQQRAMVAGLKEAVLVPVREAEEVLDAAERCLLRADVAQMRREIEALRAELRAAGR
ncbi:MAG: hypothetical protein M3N18_04350 [Actinomycetota bacterium]|nr:hypothetical protein [Actinomycetota bacterium]